MAARWDDADPIFRVNDLFPLGAPLGLVDASDEAPSGPDSRPFGLRFLRRARTIGRLDPSCIQLDPETQMAVVATADGAMIPLMKHTSGETETQTQAADRQAPDTDTDHDPNE